jgi:hypothetical protein
MLNRTFAAVSVLAFMALPLAAQGDGKEKGGREVEFTGRVIDVNCHTTGVSGPGHKECTQACAKAGVALAILSDGIIYIPVSSKPGDAQNSRLIEFAEAKVRVKGLRRFAHGLHTIEIESIAAAS